MKILILIIVDIYGKQIDFNLISSATFLALFNTYKNPALVQLLVNLCDLMNVQLCAMPHRNQKSEISLITQFHLIKHLSGNYISHLAHLMRLLWPASISQAAAIRAASSLALAFAT